MDLKQKLNVSVTQAFDYGTMAGKLEVLGKISQIKNLDSEVKQYIEKELYILKSELSAYTQNH